MESSLEHFVRSLTRIQFTAARRMILRRQRENRQMPDSRCLSQIIGYAGVSESGALQSKEAPQQLAELKLADSGQDGAGVAGYGRSADVTSFQVSPPSSDISTDRSLSGRSLR